jgi:metallophosphoesterase (TIGR00282 family)
MNILMVGDVVGRPGRDAVRDMLRNVQQRFDIEFTLVNTENSAGGMGLTPDIANLFFKWGADVQTGGNHIWQKKDIIPYIESEPRLIRPANFSDGVPGRGYGVFQSESGFKVAVIHLVGRVFMMPQEDPFKTVDSILEELNNEAQIILVDFHAEATSEKVAMGWFLDGRVSLVAGTHTHIPTADETILPKGTAYITDVGMSGPYDSVIGVQKEIILRKFTTGMPQRYEVAENGVKLSGIIIKVDENTGKAESIRRISINYERNKK